MSFDSMDERQALALAAAAAERVLPVFAHSNREDVDALADALRLVWLEVEGRSISKQQFTRSLNAVLLHAPEHGAARHAARAVAAAVETAMHNRDAAGDALSEAIAAVAEACGEDAANEETGWQQWAAALPDVSRSAFTDESAPDVAWRSELSSGDLPLFATPKR